MRDEPVTDNICSSQQLFACAPVPLVAVDETLRVVSVTPAYLDAFALSREGIMGLPLADTVPFVKIPGAADSVNKFLQSAIEHDARVSIETEIIPLQPAMTGLKIRAGCDNGAVVGSKAIVVHVEPLSSTIPDQLATLERHHADLKRSNDELEQFAFIASHDLQEPLRTITAHLQLLQRKYAPLYDYEALRHMAYVTAAADRMRLMVTAILEFARVGSQAPVMEMVQSSDCLLTALDNLGAKILASDATVTPGELPLVSADSVHLTRIFQNLLSNAVKFRADRPLHIRITATDECDMWRFSVSDNGIGIPTASQSRLFRLFERVHGQQYQGSGIGLATCRRLVEHNKGHIWFESEEHVGSTFYFTLPKAHDDT